MFDEYKPRVDRLVRMQRDLVAKIFNDAKMLLDSDDPKKRKEGSILLLRAHKPVKHIQRSHPLRVTFCQIIIHGHHVDPASCQSIQEYGQCGNQCFSFSCRHLGNLALMQHGTTNQLHVYNRVDKLEEEIDKKVEDILTELLPVAFAVMKDTARRFKENEEIEVTATQFDRDLAVNHDFVEIEGDKAVWFNSWIAGGNEVTWDMVHYDVQLIGGAVLRTHCWYRK